MSQFEDISSLFVSPAEQSVHGESVIFTGDGPDKAIVAIIERPGAQIQGMTRNQRIEYQAIATIYRTDVSRIIPGGQTVKLRLRKGDSQDTELSVKAIISQDGAAWRVTLN